MSQYLQRIHVCLNGHAQPNHEDIKHTPRCLQCGDLIVSECRTCSEPLPIADEFDLHPSAPAHCGYCGEPHEWTQRRKQAAIEMFVENVGTTKEDRESFTNEIEHISRDTPRAQLAATRINKLLDKVPGSIRSLIRDILVGIASNVIAETIKSPS